MYLASIVGIIYLLCILVYNIVLMLLVTMIIAALTLIERKVLSLLQRRVGPNFVGFRGRLQYIADALKLIVKGILIPNETNKMWFVALPAATGAVCYTFWLNSVWGPSFGVFEIEYNIVYSLLLSTIMCYCVVLTGYFSRNKYAFLASIRSGVMLLSLEVMLSLLLVNLVLFAGSFCFSVFVVCQEVFWFIFSLFGLSGVVVMIFLLETNRAPFDLAEAESELVAGYTVEFGGFFFALFYLGEYFHLFFFSMVASILLFGGWELPNFCLYFLMSKYGLVF